MDGEGQLTLTGQLGDVMKESAHLAISWLRSNAKRYQLTNGGAAQPLHGDCSLQPGGFATLLRNPGTYSLGRCYRKRVSAMGATLRMRSAPECLCAVLCQLLPSQGGCGLAEQELCLPAIAWKVVDSLSSWLWQTLPLTHFYTQAFQQCFHDGDRYGSLSFFSDRFCYKVL